MVTHLTKAGLGSLELFSMGLKSTGTYLSRALSYKGAEFSIAKVEIDPQFQCVLLTSTAQTSPASSTTVASCTSHCRRCCCSDNGLLESSTAPSAILRHYNVCNAG
jgi:P-loop containing NTP hydrolase pore-1